VAVGSLQLAVCSWQFSVFAAARLVFSLQLAVCGLQFGVGGGRFGLAPHMERKEWADCACSGKLSIFAPLIS